MTTKIQNERRNSEAAKRLAKSLEEIEYTQPGWLKTAIFEQLNTAVDRYPGNSLGKQYLQLWAKELPPEDFVKSAIFLAADIKCNKSFIPDGITAFASDEAMDKMLPKLTYHEGEPPLDERDQISRRKALGLGLGALGITAYLKNLGSLKDAICDPDANWGQTIKPTAKMAASVVLTAGSAFQILQGDAKEYAARLIQHLNPLLEEKMGVDDPELPPLPEGRLGSMTR